MPPAVVFCREPNCVGVSKVAERPSMPFWSKAAVWLAPGLFEETKRTTGAGKASLIRESSPGRKICFVFVLVPAWCHLGAAL